MPQQISFSEAFNRLARHYMAEHNLTRQEAEQAIADRHPDLNELRKRTPAANYAPERCPSVTIQTRDLL